MADAFFKLPEGNTGIAARYKGDKGIEADPSVIFFDDFESYSNTGDILSKWDVMDSGSNIRIATEAENVYRGNKALEYYFPRQEKSMSIEIAKKLVNEVDVLFLRFYQKIDKSFDAKGSIHNGGVISSRYYPGGRATPGKRADGKNKFLAGFENERTSDSTPNPGHLNVYIYHPEQRGDYGDHFFPSGRVLPDSNTRFDFGPDFIPRPDIIQELGVWHCHEFMVKANTVGKRDGRIACWLNGNLIADFTNLRLRDTEELMIDRFGLTFWIAHNANSSTKKWYDNVVAATSYIGPIAE